MIQHSIEDFSLILPKVQELYSSMVDVSYILIPLFFILNLALQYFRWEGGPDYADALRRLLIVMILLTTFPLISGQFINISEWVSGRIDPQGGFKNLFVAASQSVSEKNHTFLASPIKLVSQFIYVGILGISYALLAFARYFIFSVYYFLWSIGIILAPLLITFYLFPALSGLTRNLFMTLAELCSWKVLWSIFAVLFTSLPYTEYYKASGNDAGNFITLACLNLIIALSILFTPFLVKNFFNAAIGSATPMLSKAVPYKVLLGAKALAFSKVNRILASGTVKPTRGLLTLSRERSATSLRSHVSKRQPSSKESSQRADAQQMNLPLKG